MATRKDIDTVKETIIRIEHEIKVKSEELAAILTEKQEIAGRMLLKSMEIGASSAQLDVAKQWLAIAEEKRPQDLGQDDGVEASLELSLFGRKKS